ncbi:thermosome subunit alpha [Sulfolobus acidocaldarius]|uniref:Chaperonin subunit alpha n=4 Tax=Sulfolobus acidocaldarius TaxID=2285 RepID=THSA_SULAC|nr:thermosome subunit alpha [Sulfolobus acidocaldarius]Q9V2T5.2 RecName: Full=Thermosome subunit alpha; AltName: Full=Chaperonin subunit alpha; AltName: Full=Thermophilic factor 55 alpha; Short=TF55-alpha; AltName: Full=Thermosome subunit 1 [Sulfolobus acidocaldarius DSM 639]AAY80731.1 thermosome alpha subunit [Sulfolobus acidocaldarius DSM 639]AGE71328.1 thermosome [Sulfolobus acidocaldarius N8]AGE73597.1 thermosome [Sulfolobus acidocaldarius Ron12/I]ALU30660.1 thermosome subunit [Sulfolobus 
MAGPVLLFKEGTSRSSGRDALRNNILAAVTLAEMLKSSLGPRGLDKMLIDSFGDVTITNDGATIVKEMEIQHPAAKLLVEAAKAQDAEVGDGTTSAVVLAGLLLDKAEELLEQNVHPTIIIDGYKKALTKALEIIDQLSLKIDVNDLSSPTAKAQLKKIVSTTMSSKFIAGGAEEIDKIIDLVIDAITIVAEKRPDGTYNVPLDLIKIDKKKGGSIEDSILVHGLVLDKEVVHAGMPRRVEKAKIAVLDAALEVEKPEISAKISITSPEQIKSFLDEEARYLKEMVDKLASIGANVVICQKGIDDVAQHFLAKKGILAVRRVKRSDIEKLEKALGARIISSIKDATPEDLGYAELVEERRIGNDKMVFIEGAKNPRAVNILLRGSNDMALDEAERSLNDALHSLRNVLMKPMIVAGGGAVESELALRLREYARSVGGKEQLAIEKFAEALEEIPMILAETAGMEPIQALMDLRARHAKGLVNSGIDAVNGKIADDMMKINVIEPVRVKSQVLKSAVEAATAILKIDDLVAASALKTEKGKKEGGEGAGAETPGAPSLE